MWGCKFRCWLRSSHHSKSASLVELFPARNVTGAKQITEAVTVEPYGPVESVSGRRRSMTVRTCRALRSENAGMSKKKI